MRMLLLALAACGLGLHSATAEARDPPEATAVRAPSVDIATLRTALRDMRARGTTGDRRIDVTFATEHPDVRLTREVRRRNPGLITIVLQHQFANLAITRNGFAVDLWFHGRRERVVVPFAAVRFVKDQLIDHEVDI